jgi:hypothetical protein
MAFVRFWSQMGGAPSVVKDPNAAAPALPSLPPPPLLPTAEVAAVRVQTACALPREVARIVAEYSDFRLISWATPGPLPPALAMAVQGPQRTRVHRVQPWSPPPLEDWPDLCLTNSSSQRDRWFDAKVAVGWRPHRNPPEPDRRVWLCTEQTVVQLPARFALRVDDLSRHQSRTWRFALSHDSLPLDSARGVSFSTDDLPLGPLQNGTLTSGQVIEFALSVSLRERCVSLRAWNSRVPDCACMIQRNGFDCAEPGTSIDALRFAVMIDGPIVTATFVEPEPD